MSKIKLHKEMDFKPKTETNFVLMLDFYLDVLPLSNIICKTLCRITLSLHKVNKLLA